MILLSVLCEFWLTLYQTDMKGSTSCKIWNSAFVNANYPLLLRPQHRYYGFQFGQKVRYTTTRTTSLKDGDYILCPRKKAVRKKNVLLKYEWCVPQADTMFQTRVWCQCHTLRWTNSGTSADDEPLRVPVGRINRLEYLD
jgi:hypothetical protein